MKTLILSSEEIDVLRDAIETLTSSDSWTNNMKNGPADAVLARIEEKLTSLSFADALENFDPKTDILCHLLDEIDIAVRKTVASMKFQL